ncbi:MAG: RNA-directed DNA polymerase [Alphaproteobacteria bacterium]
MPTGSTGFRITTKLHPFWNVYFNGLGVAIAEKHEPIRNENAHSYRFVFDGEGLFDRERSWRAYREATLKDRALQEPGAMVVQTDVSSFYEHIYHHRLQNCIADLFPKSPTIATQIDRLLSKFASGRSFGLPVGGQCARVLAELLMTSIDQMLTDAGVIWHRYVDDFTLLTKSQEDAYRALSVLSHSLADYGLSLNRTKTTILSAKHYSDYVSTQLEGEGNDESRVLREIDLHFDPYSDSKVGDYRDLKKTVQKLDIQLLIKMELNKGHPDTFLVAQIGRTLRFQSPLIAIQLCETLLDPKNLHAFRASWSTIMRGIAAVRSEADHEEIFDLLDRLLDDVPEHSAHLLLPEASCLHYLKTIRFCKTRKRAQYLLYLFEHTSTESIKRACIDCWRQWLDRPNFIRLRNRWSTLGPQAQRMVWLAAAEFGDDGKYSRLQVRKSLPNVWKLGIEQKNKSDFVSVFMDWAKDGIQ